MNGQPYSDATVSLVVKAIVDADWASATPGNLTAQARASLDALAAAGLLVTEGTEGRTEWGVRITWDDGHAEEDRMESEAFARRRVALHAHRRATDPGWRVTAELISRQVATITGPWTAAA